MRRIKARKDEIAGRSRDGVAQWMRGLANATVVAGEAHFESPRTVRVGKRLLEAEQIFINVGGRPSIPPLPGIAEVPFLTSESMMDVDVVPEHLAIVGGSYIGLEFAQMYRRFGARATIIEKDSRLIPREDGDISSAVQDILEA